MVSSFIESPRFPDTIAYGARGGPRFLTSLTQGSSGAEASASLWAQDKGEWDIGLINRTDAETEALLAFFALAKGRANGFRFHDFQTGEGIGVNEYIATGDGTTQIFQLQKWYTIGSETYARRITKPVSGTVTVTVNGVVTTPTTINTTHGKLFFTTPPTTGVVIRATFEFDVPVRFDIDWLQIRRIDTSIWSWEQCTLLEVPDPVSQDFADDPTDTTNNKVLLLLTLNQDEIEINSSGPTIASATLYGVTGNAGGTVHYTVYFLGTDRLSHDFFADGGIKTVVNAIVPNADGMTLDQPGYYEFDAVYSGDANNPPLTGLPRPLYAQARHTVTIVLSSASFSVGDGATADVFVTVTSMVSLETLTMNGIVHFADGGTATVVAGVATGQSTTVHLVGPITHNFHATWTPAPTDLRHWPSSV